MSKEKAKEILYKHEELSGGAINHWQAQWIIDAMIEYHEDRVKKNVVLDNVSYCSCENRSDNWFDDNGNNCFDCDKRIKEF